MTASNGRVCGFAGYAGAGVFIGVCVCVLGVVPPTAGAVLVLPAQVSGGGLLSGVDGSASRAVQPASAPAGAPAPAMKAPLVVTVTGDLASRQTLDRVLASLRHVERRGRDGVLLVLGTGQAREDLAHELARAVAAVPLPTVAVIGDARGGGVVDPMRAAVALAADRVVVMEGAVIAGDMDAVARMRALVVDREDWSLTGLDLRRVLGERLRERGVNRPALVGLLAPGWRSVGVVDDGAAVTLVVGDEGGWPDGAMRIAAEDSVEIAGALFARLVDGEVLGRLADVYRDYEITQPRLNHRVEIEESLEQAVEVSRALLVDVAALINRAEGWLEEAEDRDARAPTLDRRAAARALAMVERGREELLKLEPTFAIVPEVRAFDPEPGDRAVDLRGDDGPRDYIAAWERAVRGLESRMERVEERAARLEREAAG